MGLGEDYKITIYYREPVYELYHGRKAQPFTWTLRVKADDPGAAKDQAIEDFKAMERLSGVNWTREIVAVELTGGLSGAEVKAQAPSGVLG